MTMNGNGAERLVPLTLIDRHADQVRDEAPAAPVNESELIRDERALRGVAAEMAAALEHLERALLVSKGTGLTGRVQDAFAAVDALQREAAREFGRKVGDRLGRESLWRVRKGVDAP